MIALVPVRAGELALGGEEAAAEAGGRVLLVGEGLEEAVRAVHGVATEVVAVPAGPCLPARWSVALAPLLVEEDVVILPASADGRSLAPRLAHRLGRPLLAGAVAVRPRGACLVGEGGQVLEDVEVDGAFVATLQPGVRGVEDRADAEPPEVAVLDVEALGVDASPAEAPSVEPLDAEVVELLAADPATIDLADAVRIVAGGAGLGGDDPPGLFDLLRRVGLRLGAATGGTRVATDLGWLPVDRQIGTTGVSVDPDLYVAFGISGAVQHVAGLGRPDHLVSVNLDGFCPMTSQADLGIVADAPATLRALAVLLGVRS